MKARLAELGVASFEERVAVVAAGSNASPARLVDKCGPDAVIPVIRTWLRGWAAVYSAHISRYGSIAASLWAQPESSTSVAITLLDAEQVRLVDATEPNYRRVDLGDLLGGPIGPITGYVTRRGALRIDESPIRLTELEATSPLRSLRQPEVLDLVAARSGLAGSGEQLSEGVRTGSIAQASVIDWMADGRSMKP